MLVAHRVLSTLKSPTLYLSSNPTGWAFTSLLLPLSVTAFWAWAHCLVLWRFYWWCWKTKKCFAYQWANQAFGGDQWDKPIIGLSMLTIGNFFGGTEVNESWGGAIGDGTLKRHGRLSPSSSMRSSCIFAFIPKLNSVYVFSIASL